MMIRTLYICAVTRLLAMTAQAQQASRARIDNFRKAFSACLEAKDYIVKY